MIVPTLFLATEPATDSNMDIIFQVIGAIGGLLGLVAALSLPFTIKKMKAETVSIEASVEREASNAALNHLKLALEEADKTIQRIKNETTKKINDLETQVNELIKSLSEERARSKKERELHDRRVVQLLYELHAKEQELERFRDKEV